MKKTEKHPSEDSTSDPLPPAPLPPVTPPPTQGDTKAPVEPETPRMPVPEEWPEEEPSPGWQQPPIPIEEQPYPCTHIGRVFASLGLARHHVGHEWICECGQVFVVIINKGDKKILKKKEDVVDA